MAKRIKKFISTFIFSKKNKNINVLDKSLGFLPINETKKNDIFIAGYPKSGNTWMQNLITGLLLESDSKRITPNLVNEIVPDVHVNLFYKRLFPVMVFKTHHLPKKEYGKVIHLVRDGRDAMVSYYKMNVNMDKNYRYTLDNMVIGGNGLFPTKWHVHTREWIKNPFAAEILTIRYEDLINDAFQELKKICNFIGISISDNTLEKIILSNSIKSLRNKVLEFGVNGEENFKNNHVSSFFRKGKIGDYKDEMEEDLINYFEKESKVELEKFKYL